MDETAEMVKTDNLIYEYKLYNEDDQEGPQVKRALDGVSFSIKKGEFVAVLGHNGSGKSTLAKHINVLLTPTEGHVWVNGMDTREEKHLWDIRQSAGMVFQNPDHQIIATIVEEDVAFGPENMGVPSAEIRERVDRALAAVDMTAYSNHSPHFLSGGQKQRVAIAGILAMLPDCIVLDEPTAMLDPIGRREVMNTIMELNRERGMTVILITHYMDEAVRAERVVVMEEGQIVMDAPPKEVFSHVEQLKAIGLDVPQVTEIAFKLRQKGIPLPEGILSIDEMVNALCRLKSKT